MTDTIIKTVADVLAEMVTPTASPQLVKDWKSMIPEWSEWHPGDPGDPNCKECKGTGYIRLEGLPIGHKYFGKLLFCKCAAQKVRQWEARQMQEAENPRSMPSYLK